MFRNMLIVLLVLFGGLATAATVDGTSIQDAINVAQEGEVIEVLGGSEAAPRLYPERIDFQASSGADGVTVIAVPRRSVLMYGFRTRGAGSGLTIEGFQVTIPDSLYPSNPVARNAIMVASQSVTIKDNYIFNVPGDGISSEFTSGMAPPWWNDGHIVDNHLYMCGAGVAINNGNNWLIDRNEIERLVWNSDARGDCDYSRAFGNNIIFRYNYFHGTRVSEIGPSHVDGFQTFALNGLELHNLVFENNIVLEWGQGVILQSQDGPGRISDITIRNNIFDAGDYTAAAFGVLVSQNTQNVSVTHNLVANSGIHGIGFYSDATGVVQNNILYNAGTNYHADGGASIVGGYNLISPTGYPFFSVDTDILDMDPMFIDPNNWVGADGIPFTADDGYALMTGSLAIGAASDGSNIGPSLIVVEEPEPDNPPVITMLGSGPVTVEVGVEYVDAGATASDPEDGDITDNIVVTNNVDTSSVGMYTVSYDVIDSDGNSAVQVFRTVDVVLAEVEPEPEVIVLQILDVGFTAEDILALWESVQ